MRSSKVDDAPAFQFYVKDWLVDTRVLSLTERGIWADCLATMWTSPERGVLLNANGCVPDAEWYAGTFGAPAVIAAKNLEEIVRKGVASRRSDGAIYCRRMVRLAEQMRGRSDAARRAAQMRWGCESHANHAAPTPIPTPTPSASPDTGGADADAPAGEKRNARRFSDEDRAAVRAWLKTFADCYREVNGSWPTGYEPESKRWPEPKIANAALWFSTRTVLTVARPRLLAVLRGEFYATPPANLAEFRAMYDRLTDACRKPAKGGRPAGATADPRAVELERRADACYRRNPGCQGGKDTACQHCDAGPRERPRDDTPRQPVLTETANARGQTVERYAPRSAGDIARQQAEKLTGGQHD